MRRSSQPSPHDPLGGLIIYEDRDVLVVNKPAGMLTASGPKDRRPTLWSAVQARAVPTREQVGIIHRLDRDASGLLVFSKNDEAYQSLKKQFFQHTVDRIYMAIVAGAPQQPAGTIESRLIEWKDGTVHSTKQRNKGEVAISHYETCSTHGPYSLVRVKLETGRKHQIRVHLAEMKTPIIGDVFYNPRTPAEPKRFTRNPKTPPPRLMLVALHLAFDHPTTGQRLDFEIPLPTHMRDLLRTAQPDVPPAPKPQYKPKHRK